MRYLKKFIEESC